MRESARESARARAGRRGALSVSLRPGGAKRRVSARLRGERCESENAWLMPINEDFHNPQFVLETGDLPEWPTKATALRPDSIGLSGSLERCWGAHDARRRLLDEGRSEL